MKKEMSRRNFMKTAAAGAAAVAAAGLLGGCGKKDGGESQASGGEGKAVTMKVHLGVTENHFESLAMNAMKEYVEKESGGSIKMEMYPNNVLGDDQDIFEGLKLDVANITPCGVDVIANYVSEFGLLSLPYLFKDMDQAHDVMRGEFGDALKAKLDAIGYVGLEFCDFGFRHITNSIRPIEKVEDLKGMKMRVMNSQVYLDTFEAMGTIPTAMAFSELYSALQQGVVDGQENPLSNIYANGLHEVQKYCVLDGHTYSQLIIVLSKQWFEALSAEQQQIIRDGAVIARDYMANAVEEDDNTARKAMEESGIEFTELTEEGRKGFEDAVSGVRDKYGKQFDAELYEKLLQAIG